MVHSLELYGVRKTEKESEDKGFNKNVKYKVASGNGHFGNKLMLRNRRECNINFYQYYC